MTKEGRDELRRAKAAGTKAARDAVNWEVNYAWTEYIDDNVSTLLRENPGHKWTKKELLRYAKNILIDVSREVEPDRSIGSAYGWSDDYYKRRMGISRGDIRQAWSEAMRKTILSVGMIRWLTDELAFQLDQRK